MSSYSSKAVGLHIPKQRQQQQQIEEDRVAKHEQSRIPQELSNQSQQCETIGTKRSYPWPELAVLQPRLESSTHARSIIGVQSILNPTESGDSQVDKRSAHDNHGSNNNVTMELLRPPTLPPSPQRRSSSSPLLAPISNQSSAKPYIQHSGGSSVSPPHPPRRIITPVSPALRYASVGGGSNTPNTGSIGATVAGATATGKVSVSQSPFVQELSAGIYSTPGHGPGSSGLAATSIESSSASRFSPPLSIAIPGRNPLSRHTTPTFHHRRHPSGGLATNPSSQASSPRTPHSTFSFAPSPSITSGLLPPPGQAFSLASSVDSASHSPFMGMEPYSRTPSRMSGPRYGDDQQAGAPYPGPSDLVGQNSAHQPHYGGPMIPVTIDMKSGSRSQAEKRKANSDASRRFRNRKKNEAALEQKISQLNEQLQCLTDERDFYRSERNFFRDTLGRHVDIAQMPPRPPSPSPIRQYSQAASSPGDQPSPSEQHQKAIGGEVMSKSISTGTASSLASGTPQMLPTPVSGSDSLPYPPSAAGQHPSESWQSVRTPSSDYQQTYREEPRYVSMRRH